MSQRATVLAPAKINLALRVGRERPDGYHDIDTLFQAIDLSDDVEVELCGDDVTLEVEGADLGPIEQNLAFRAASRFLEEVAPGRGAAVRLLKKIPHGAGLGGGSSDAAAVLRCLTQLTGGLPAARLRGIGAELGSDVPFFLGDSPLARGRGRGEVLESLPALPVADLVLVSPPVHVATSVAYSALSASRGDRATAPEDPGPLTVRNWGDLGAVAHNDFEPILAAEHREIGQALAALLAAGATVASMTGSGSSCFGFFGDAPRAKAAAEGLAEELAWPCRAVRTLQAFPRPLRGI